MKRFIGLILSVVLITGLMAGCADAPADKNSAEDKLPETKIYTDKAGRQVEVPVKPQRIVTISSTPEAVALGIKPVGAADNWARSLDASQKEGIESIGAVAGLNLEKILELEPEVIITPERVTDEETWEALSKIAPTVVGPFFGDAIENLRTIGDLLGRTEEAEAWISQYESKIFATKEQLKDVIEEGKTALVIQVSSSAKSGAYIYPHSTWPIVYDILSLELPNDNELRDQIAGAELSIEKLAEYDPDYIFLTSTDDSGMPQLVRQFTENSVWQTLSAVKNNRIYTMGSRLSSGDALTLEWALDDVIRAVEEVTN
ncbi:ABC transporter substrate-binding protein [Sedimentibacter sp.]|uniref:ABC transporter substrate-binding protein n=1 Tax=Sedimentibacter sp. TaxID=1960295 RepID=UPI00289862F2|nr:ABC transporter substrate-binding protein [Sedimentibacter sp.]